MFIAPLAALCLAAAPAFGAQTMTGASASDLVRQLHAGDPAARAAARQSLVALGAEAVPALVNEMVDEPRGRDRVQGLILRIGKPAEAPLLALLSDAKLQVQAASTLFLVAGPTDTALLPKMIDCLERRPELSQSCGQTLVRVAGPAAKSQRAALIRLASSKRADSRVYAAAALGMLGAAAGSEGVAALTRALDDGEPAVRRAACEALGRLERRAKSALPRLQALSASEPVAEVKAAAAEAARRIGG